MIEEHCIVEPYWLKAMIERLVQAISPINVMGKLGYRYLEPETLENPSEAWQVAVFPTPNEVYGGCHDGELVYPGFSVDLAHFTSAFSSVEAMVWNAPTVYNGELDGPEVSVKGVFAGTAVLVRIFATPPPGEEPSLVVDLAKGNYWEKAG